MSKRLLLAQTMQSLGVTKALELFRTKPGILIIAHHRIGNARDSQFDHGIFSATPDQLDQQVAYLKRHLPVIGIEELEDLVARKKALRHLHVVLTFDDGYLDNYTQAFGILRSHGCTGSFFLVPTYVGTNAIPWWDAIAYLVRNTRKTTLSLSIPDPLTITIAADREKSILDVLRHYRRPENTRGDDFIAELQSEADCDLPVPNRRFLDWSEAIEMQSSGMTIGSHTYTHRMLTQLSEREQQEELTRSRAILEERLDRCVSTLAYPVGAFTPATERLALDAGYHVCLSFCGGINTRDRLRQTDLLRATVEPDPVMFRNQMAFLSFFGRIPYANLLS